MIMDKDSAVSALKQRDDVIKSLDNKCYKLSRLSRTLLDALESSIVHKEMSYDDRTLMKTETKAIIGVIENNHPIETLTQD